MNSPPGGHWCLRISRWKIETVHCRKLLPSGRLLPLASWKCFIGDVILVTGGTRLTLRLLVQLPKPSTLPSCGVKIHYPLLVLFSAFLFGFRRSFPVKSVVIARSDTTCF